LPGNSLFEARKGAARALRALSARPLAQRYGSPRLRSDHHQRRPGESGAALRFSDVADAFLGNRPGDRLGHRGKSTNRQGTMGEGPNQERRRLRPRGADSQPGTEQRVRHEDGRRLAHDGIRSRGRLIGPATNDGGEVSTRSRHGASPVVRSILGLILAATVSTTASVSYSLDIQGHRGARGLRPENTLPAFAHALSLGVTTLELDT